MPAYNAERTLAATLADVPAGCVDEVILVDDGSTDRTVQVARRGKSELLIAGGLQPGEKVALKDPFQEQPRQ